LLPAADRSVQSGKRDAADEVRTPLFKLCWVSPQGGDDPGGRFLIEDQVDSEWLNLRETLSLSEIL